MYRPIHPLVCLLMVIITIVYAWWSIRTYKAVRKIKKENDDYERFYGDDHIGI